MRGRAWVVLGLAACGGAEPVDPGPTPTDWEALFPAPDAWGGTDGPGLMAQAPSATLLEHCAYLTGGPEDIDHHNLVVMMDGWLLLPWAPEDGGGGITVFDASDPCAPVKVGEAFDARMRESHTLGLSLRDDGTRYVAVAYLEPDGSGGVGFWDLTDETDPRWVGQVKLDGHAYPDSYLRVMLSVTWVGDHVYAATAGRGVFVIDASDPTAPVVLERISFDRPHIVGTFHVWGVHALASSAGVQRTVLMDLSDPLAPVVPPQGDFNVTTPDDGKNRAYYFANMGADYALFARSSDGGGAMLYDLFAEGGPAWVGGIHDVEGDGGYVFQHGDRLYVGNSQFASVYDITDPTQPSRVAEVDLKGDLDTLTPLGPYAVASVDEKSDDGRSTAVIPIDDAPDTRAPRAGLRSPFADAEAVAPTARIGLAFDEMIEPASVFAGSFRVVADGEPVEGAFNAQENLVNFTPSEPLPAGATVEVQLPAGGIADISGNTLAEPVSWSFRVAP